MKGSFKSTEHAYNLCGNGIFQTIPSARYPRWVRRKDYCHDKIFLTSDTEFRAIGHSYLTFTSAPRDSSSLQRDASPVRAAVIRGVFPWLSAACAFAPARNNISAMASIDRSKYIARCCCSRCGLSLLDTLVQRETIKSSESDTFGAVDPAVSTRAAVTQPTRDWSWVDLSSPCLCSFSRRLQRARQCRGVSAAEEVARAFAWGPLVMKGNTIVTVER